MGEISRMLTLVITILLAWWIWGLISIWLFGLRDTPHPSWSSSHRLLLHPFLMSLSVALFITGALTYRWSPFGYTISKWLHGFIQVCAATVFAVGLSAMFTVHKSPHFYSAHSWCGLTSIILLAFQAVFGIIVAFGPRSSTTIAAMIRGHRLTGQILLFFLLLTVLMGVQHFMTYLLYGAPPHHRPSMTGAETTLAGITSLVILFLVPLIHIIFHIKPTTTTTTTTTSAPVPESYMTAPTAPTAPYIE